MPPPSAMIPANNAQPATVLKRSLISLGFP
jgi:hypothetical protein